MHMTRDDTELALTLSFIWKFAMADPENPELPSLGVFECMTRLIKKSVEDVEWVMTGQNVYVPYYAVHIIGSYTMKKPEFAVKAVESGVIAPLLELMRGKISWIEQRVVVRALGHLASYERTFEAVAAYEDEVVRLAMEIATTCVDVVYEEFIVFCCFSKTKKQGDIEGAIKCYNEAISLCPLKLRRKRMILYSDRGECYLLLGDVDAAISDCTRALCLSEPVNSHGKSLWTRSRAYDIKGLSRESLMDCIMFVNGRCFRGKIPYYATQMISKQMEATWLFEEARASRVLRQTMLKEKNHLTGLSTITEEPGKKKDGMMMQRNKL
ncbi:hypothetical protein AALP_AA6G152700 [Arabis alpina]|uniref:ARM repeat N-terminal plant domain-containing protein n=1 Tax=Arabis alpina TaxID=50452 RepID=A0A087GPD8_ARAAL|nr:hypothetical protein AALP_AA6G152700 [Arabis alpina]